MTAPISDLLARTLGVIERELGPDAAKAAWLNADEIAEAARLEREAMATALCRALVPPDEPEPEEGDWTEDWARDDAEFWAEMEEG